VGYLCANFSLFLGLSVLELRQNARCTRQTDRRQTEASLNAPPIRDGGIITNSCTTFSEIHDRNCFFITPLTGLSTRVQKTFPPASFVDWDFICVS